VTQNTHNFSLDNYTIISHNIPQRFDPQTIINIATNQSNTAYNQISRVVYTVDTAYKSKLVKMLTFLCRIVYKRANVR